jgi:phage terminase large subunit GpA-like protein
MGSAQIGKTEIINNIIGYKIDLDPCAIILMQPTDKDAKDYSQQKLEPMLEDTVCLRKKIGKKKSRGTDTAMLRKKFIGGWLMIVSGNSPSATRSRTAKLTIGDDIDAIPIGFQREGDPILRLIKRSTTYHDSVNINISTPTRSGESRIEFLYNQSSKAKYYVNCIHCNHEQLLEEENLVWEKDFDMFQKVTGHHPETVKYQCPSCKLFINEYERKQMLKRGYWKHERKNTTHLGYWINELSSTLSTMQKVATEIVNAGVDIKNGALDLVDASEEKLEALFNTVLGRPFESIRGESIDTTELIDNISDFINPKDMLIPNDILLITAGVDVQQGGFGKEQRLEVKFIGWGKGKQNWILYRTYIPGSIKDHTSKDSPWLNLDKIWQMLWKRKDGITIPVVCKFIDSGFEAQEVYEYTTGKSRQNIYAIKGANRYGADLLQRKPIVVNKGRTRLVIIGTQHAKHVIYGNLKTVKQPGAKYTHFAKAFCDAEYFKQIAAEHAVRKHSGMVDYIIYEKRKKSLANEAIDLFVYAYAAMEFINPNFDAIERNINRLKEQPKTEQTNEVEAIAKQPTPAPLRRTNLNIKPKNNFATGWK